MDEDLDYKLRPGSPREREYAGLVRGLSRQVEFDQTLIEELKERYTRLEGAVTRAIEACGNCRAGTCTADAHVWLKAGLAIADRAVSK